MPVNASQTNSNSDISLVLRKKWSIFVKFCLFLVNCSCFCEILRVFVKFLVFLVKLCVILVKSGFFREF